MAPDHGLVGGEDQTEPLLFLFSVAFGEFCNSLRNNLLELEARVGIETKNT